MTFLYIILSTEYYQKKHKKTLKKASKMYLGLSNSEKKTRNISMIMNDIEIFQKNKKQKMSVWS